MPEIDYRNFDVLIERENGNDSYEAIVLRSSAGDGRARFSLGELGLTAPQSPVADTPAATYRHLVPVTDTNFLLNSKAPTVEEARRFGIKLFESVFRGDLLECFNGCQMLALRDKTPLRIRLNLSQVPELSNLPWEYLCNPKFGGGRFYAQSVGTPIVRYLEHNLPIRELDVEGPARLLVMISSPKDAPSLDVNTEWFTLKEALSHLEKAGLLHIDMIEEATLSGLQDRLMRNRFSNPYHIFHFIGHGAYDAKTGEGSLLFEDELGASRLVSGRRLGTLFQDEDSLRLVVLNACEGARSSTTNAYTGLAQSLIEGANIPAVVGMQFEITDTAALTFAEFFYKALASNHPVEAALSEARKAILNQDNEVEWATPVLYMRADSGQIFRFKPSVARERPEPGAHDLTVSDEMASHCQSVIEALVRGQLIPFLGLDVNLYGRQMLTDWSPGNGLPSSDELASHLARFYGYPGGERPDLVGVSQYAEVKYEQEAIRKPVRLYDKISEIFNAGHQPTPLHRFFASIPDILQKKKYPRTADPALQRFVIVTNTYDRLLESAFDESVSCYHVVFYVAEGSDRGRFLHATILNGQPAGSPVTIYSPNDYRGFADQNPVIVKLPGRLDTLRFAITEDHYFDYLSHKDITGLLPPQLTGKLKRSSHLFLGNSLREWNLRALLYRIWDNQKPGYQSWAVHPNMSEIDEQFWEVSKVTPIKADLKDYINTLKDMMERS